MIRTGTINRRVGAALFLEIHNFSVKWYVPTVKDHPGYYLKAANIGIENNKTRWPLPAG